MRKKKTFLLAFGPPKMPGVCPQEKRNGRGNRVGGPSLA